jgi:hypothetical protein
MSAELVPSVSIANLVNQRAAVVERVTKAVGLIREAASIAGAAHLGMPRITITTNYSRRTSSERSLSDSYLDPQRDGETYKQEAANLEEIAKMVRVGVDSTAWQYLMHQSGLRTLMDATAREKWDQAIYEGDVPELTESNVRSTFSMLHGNRLDMFERGVIACFKALSWHYKTNLPQKFGKRIVIAYLTGSSGHAKCDQLDDLTRVFHVLDGKPEPDHRTGIYSMMSGAGLVYTGRTGQVENEYLTIKTFKNHNGHITFKRLDLVEKMNKIIASHYPGTLPAPK